MSTLHSPAPWRAIFEEAVAIFGADSARVAVLTNLHINGRRDPELVAANARRIVQCVNAHDELVAALRRSLGWLSSYPGGGTLGENGPYEQARAALAKVEGSAT